MPTIDFTRLPDEALLRSREFLRPGPVPMGRTRWHKPVTDGRAPALAVWKGHLTARKWADRGFRGRRGSRGHRPGAGRSVLRTVRAKPAARTSVVSGSGRAERAHPGRYQAGVVNGDESDDGESTADSAAQRRVSELGREAYAPLGML